MMPDLPLLQVALGQAMYNRDIDSIRTYFVVAKHFLLEGRNPHLSDDYRKYLLDYSLTQLERIGKYRDAIPCGLCEVRHEASRHNCREYIECEICGCVPGDLLKKYGCKHNFMEVDLKFPELTNGLFIREVPAASEGAVGVDSCTLSLR